MTKEEFKEKYFKNGVFTPDEEKEKRHISHPEHDLQVNCVHYFHLCYPQYLIYANANGGYRTKGEARSLVAEGVVAGVPDLFIPCPNKQYHGLYIEMKNGKAGRVSENQKIVIEKLREQGYKCEIVRDFEQFCEVVNGYMQDGIK